MRRVNRVRAIRRHFMAGVVFGLLVLLALGALRYEAGCLAYRLDSLNRAIGRYSMEETALRQEFSGLVAPIRIYSYCKEQLGMEKVRVAETILVRPRGGDLTAESISGPTKGWRARVAWLFGEEN
nr:hypothetical protein [uncultured Fretibacterium sp.]